MKRFVTTVVKRFGRLDVLVNNAGVYEGGDPAEITNEQWRKVVATDLDGVFFGCRAALPHLQKTGGSIVNTASVSGTGGDWATSPYNAAKGGAVNLTRSLALDLGKFRNRRKRGRGRWRFRLQWPAAAGLAGPFRLFHEITGTSIRRSPF
jgi:NAD(P)-dependent dehydrogenase (short-subunit alcohol dehydrogenase family)